MKPTKKGNVALTSGYNRIKQTKYGYMMYNSHDVYVGGSFDSYGEFSDHEVRFVCSQIKPDHVVMDIGANYGALTIPMARCAKEVYAFEPQRPAFAAMAANVALNNLENVICENAGLSNHGGFIEVPRLNFNIANNIGGLSMKEALPPGTECPTYTVKCTTLDQYASDMNITKLDFIKMDVEGMEELVLRGGESTIRKLKPLMYIEADREDRKESLISFISSLGYDMAYHNPPLFSSDNYFNNKTNIWGRPIVSINLMCTPRKE